MKNGWDSASRITGILIMHFGLLGRRSVTPAMIECTSNKQITAFDYLEWTQLFSRSKTLQKTHNYVIVTKVRAKKNPQYVANQLNSVFDL